MKGYIDTDGDLYLIRGPNDVVQQCPFNAGGDFCGDHCPHFGEPHKKAKKDRDYTLIHLSCGNSRTVVLEDFEDKRSSE